MFDINSWHGCRSDLRALDNFLTRNQWREAARSESRELIYAQMGVKALILAAAIILVVLALR